jgi:hypothetical protein
MTRPSLASSASSRRLRSAEEPERPTAGSTGGAQGMVPKHMPPSRADRLIRIENLADSGEQLSMERHVP